MSIRNGTFSKCTSLTSITIPSSVTSIESYAFSECTSLTSITIPSGVTSIGDDAFWGCESLTSVTVPSSVKSIGTCAFNSCMSLKSITIPSSVTSMGSNTFTGCTSLTSITLSGGVTRLENYTFSGCTSLTSITVPNSVTSIGSYAFSGCTNLTSITIPSSVTSINTTAFLECRVLAIWGTEGSYAQEYALANSIPFRIIGSAESYTISYQLNGGTNNSKNPNTYTSASYITLQNPTRSGYTFSGWYTDNSFKNKITTITKDTTGKLTLYAKWKANSYKVTFNKNGGGKPSKSTLDVTHGNTYGALPTIVRKNYTFKGWYTAKSGGTKITKTSKVTITKNQTLYAQWAMVSKPGKATISSVKNNKSKQVAVKLKKVSGVKGYQILYSTNKNFKSAGKTNATSLNKTIKSLEKGKTYFFKARAYRVDSANNKIYGNYSAVRQVKIRK